MNRYSFLMLSMSLSEAKGLLGFSATDNPSESEITRAYRAKAFEAHPDRGGSEDQMVQINVARDVLTGKQRPTYERDPAAQPSTPSYGGRSPWEKAKKEEVTFAEAKSKAGIPAGVEWQFVTDSQKGTSYASDEFYRSDMSRVAYGRTATKHVFLGMRHFAYQENFIGGSADKSIWTIRCLELPIKDDEGLKPAWLYGNVVKALRMAGFEGKFNSKVVNAQGWKLDDDRLPHGKALSIKHWLVESGQVAGDAPSVAGRKNVIEVAYHTSYSPKPGLYQVPRSWGMSTEWEGISVIVNGKAEFLGEADAIKFLKSKLMGKIFGTYYYDGTTKMVSRMRDGAHLLGVLVRNFALSESAKAAIEATLAQKQPA